jgi:Amt family ammonium transporter
MFLTDLSVTELAASLDVMWVLFATVLVFFMQAGFALVESGFTRQKNSANIIMKNVLDFVVASLIYYFIGVKIMYAGADMSPAEIMFQTVFAGTAATIISGAVAERMKFGAYIIISIAVTTIIYPISGLLIWGGGLLTDAGFVDFAGSTAVHALGGFVALGVVIILGPRIGKYREDGSSNIIFGHSLTLGALGVFILWFGWFGFNGGSTFGITGANTSLVGHVFATTNIAAASGGAAALIYTWLKDNHASIGATLNGILAGLVGITAGTHAVSEISAVLIGVITSIIVTIGINLIDKKLHIDDPVGAISVHGLGGVIGTILVGVFHSTDGLITGSWKLLFTQTWGTLLISLFAFISGVIIAKVLHVLIGIRVKEIEEIEGLDIHEHQTSSYPNFSIAPEQVSQ